MKNLKIYKSAFSILTAASIVLFSGCAGNNDESNKNNVQNEPNFHRHLIINFGNTPVIFRECEGFKFNTYIREGYTRYNIKYGDKTIIDDYSYTTVYTSYCIENEETVKEIEDKVVEDGGYVYKMQ